MLIPFAQEPLRHSTELVFIAMRVEPKKLPFFKAFNHNGEEIADDSVQDGDTFVFWKNGEEHKGFYFDAEYPFRATVKINDVYEKNKGTVLLYEKENERHHLIYPLDLVHILKVIDIKQGSFTAVFKYVRKGTVYAVKMVAIG